MKYMRKKGQSTPIVFDEHLYDPKVYELVGDEPAAVRKPSTKAPAKRKAKAAKPVEVVEDAVVENAADTEDLGDALDAMLADDGDDE